MAWSLVTCLEGQEVGAAVEAIANRKYENTCLFPHSRITRVLEGGYAKASSVNYLYSQSPALSTRYYNVVSPFFPSA
jgi:hypothetical protein